ncbi:response regulator [Idiomarina sp. OT37-5b]|jgi:response regulator RpfG family c-di-GMP phosphodiesterase|uniref:Response regulator n=1 Tax=Idiomarina aquatica TaxID=1327752 RepID=A0AA94EDQ6_9GAMM|nr:MULTISPECIES: response regulator [Idiomarina]AVJ56623.1 response regulator [Idiomarina sp. OT37-5b]RUO42597.1 response regulator [Idiomarina aquatica]
MNDDFLFSEDEPEIEIKDEAEPFQILIVDDDEEIHTITRMALSDFKLDGHRLNFNSAYSGSEAKKILRERSDIAMTLLDVVMETDHAGLEVARWIRQDLKNKLIRIVLRTGQPGQAPEEDVIARYDIDDYKEKTELTYRKLVTLMYSCLRAYRDLNAIERNKRGLEKVINASAEVFSAKSMHGLCQGILEQLVALITHSDDAMYCRTDSTEAEGLTATLEGNHHFEIIGGTGDYELAIGKPVEQDIDWDLIQQLQRSPNHVEFRIHDNNYYGLYKTKGERQYLLFIKGVRELSELDQNLLGLFVNNSSIAIDNLYSRDTERAQQRELLYSVGEAIDKRSVEQISHHVKRSAEMAGQLAIYTGASFDDAEQLKLAASVYDIGKVSVQMELAQRADALSIHDYEDIMQKVIKGHDYLNQTDTEIAHLAAKIAQDIHERWDGSGFPSQKKGRDIDLNARILAITSQYDAIRTDRTYREAQTMESAADYILQHSGKFFDPEIVGLMLDNLDAIEKIRQRYPDQR